MLTYQILYDENIVVIEPKGPISEDDIQQLTREVDLHLVRTETLKGILIHAPDFPGWETMGTMISHFHFVRDHHHLIRKVALASDRTLANIIPNLMDYFVSAEVKGFGFNERDEAMAWLKRTE